MTRKSSQEKHMKELRWFVGSRDGVHEFSISCDRDSGLSDGNAVVSRQVVLVRLLPSYTSEEGIRYFTESFWKEAPKHGFSPSTISLEIDDSPRPIFNPQL